MAVLSIKEKADLQISRIKDSTSVQDRMFQTAVHTAASDLSKGDFETFMLKEIYEQPATTRTTLVGRTNDKEGIAVLGGLLDSEEFLINTKTFLFTGCGTAYNASVVGAYVMERIAGATVRTEIASEGRYKPLHTSVDTTAVFAVSQSGETADTLEYIKELKRKHYETYGIVNVVGSALSEITGKGIYTKAGSEIGVASTKAFTSQLVALYLLALYVARGKTMGIESGMQFVSNLESIPELMKNSFACVDDIKELVQKYKSFTKIQFLGRGIHVPVAQEASLKFKELTYFETGAYPLGELKHGPIAIVDKDTLSVVILPQDELFEHGVNSVEQIKSKDGKVLLITDESTRGHHICDKVDSVIYIPHIGDPLFYPFLEIIPLQLFAYYFAQMLGRNIDKPRNLAKSVTVQ
jgi:glucosamine--fructose-6-phosphate aminotransferase (isomerizing)